MARSSLEGLLVRYDAQGSPAPVAGPLSELRGTADPAQVLEPFGSLEDICSMEALSGRRERLAKKLHDAYCAKRRNDGASGDDPAIRPWPLLDETFRQANRRSADHLPVKLLSVSSRKPGNAEASRALEEAAKNPQMLEELARLEHASWRIDRELDGWRFGAERDNRRLLHPDLVDYDSLSERSKSYDREMIQIAAAAMKREIA